MYSSHPQDVTLSDISRTLWRYRGRCTLTAIAIMLAALAYALVAPQTWEASQAIVVRDEIDSSLGALGIRRYEEGLKDVQQTLLELALSRAVLINALKLVGPRDISTPKDEWPSERAVEELREATSLVAPKGAEFGKTQYFYLKVKDRQRERAIRLTGAVFTELAKAFGELRAKVADSAIAELKASMELAEANLNQATQRLSEIERNVGVDLVALRMLHQSPTGDTAVYRTLTGALEELRQARAMEGQYNAVLAMLRQGEQNPLVMLAAPRELLDCHPGLARLIQGLSESRLRIAAEASRLTAEHPEMRAVKREESGIADGIRHELSVAIQGVTAARDLAAVRRAAFETQVADLNRRLHRLTEVRAEYSNLVGQVEQRRDLVETYQRNLAQSRAVCNAATISSLLSQIDLPDGGIRPVSPRRTYIGLGGVLAGIFAGCGMVFLTAPIRRREEEEELAAPRPAWSNVGAPASPARVGGDRVAWTRVSEPVGVGDERS